MNTQPFPALIKDFYFLKLRVQLGWVFITRKIRLEADLIRPGPSKGRG